MDKEIEEWRPVPSKPGLMASSWGRIVLPERTSAMPNGGMRTYKGKPTYGHPARSSKTARHSYMGLSNRIYGNIKVHRAVCEAFHGPPPTPSHVVIHIDENARNNCPGNLRWGTQKENLNMPEFIKYCKSRTGENSPIAKWKKRLSGLAHPMR